jgi:NAD(P)-dependent dehydrogenase (short-subunit alcohol dehydrogenase family)
MTQFDLEGTVAVVTGGSRGVGPHIAAALAQRGAWIAWWHAVNRS